jgi:hypothetical protein
MPLHGSLLFENVLWHLHVDADIRFVYKLSDRDIPGNTDQLIRLLLRQFRESERKSTIS